MPIDNSVSQATVLMALPDGYTASCRKYHLIILEALRSGKIRACELPDEYIRIFQDIGFIDDNGKVTDFGKTV